MKLVTILLSRSFFAILGLGCLACNNGATDKKKSEAYNTIDTSQAIAYATQYLFDNSKFPKGFADTPMMVIRSEKISLSKPFVVNGKEISFVKPEALTDSIMNDWKKPKPFMEVVNFKMAADSILVDLKFKTARTEFVLSLRPIETNKFSVRPLSEIQY